jgi:tRNA threonylcarbamoyladenosine biosynthesis protein TsaB
MNSKLDIENAAALAIETSSALGSVAVGRGRNILGTVRFTQPRAHAAEFLPSIDALCREHNIKPDEIAHVFVSAGPGSFTGLRIGITAARTLALAVGARIVALPTLEVIAQNALDLPEPPRRVCVILDAKRARVYTAMFELSRESGANPPPSQGGLEAGKDDKLSKRYSPLDEPHEADPASYLASLPPDCAVLGEGVLYHQAAVSGSGLRVLEKGLFAPRVETVYRLGFERASKGLFIDARDLIPIYIRAPEAEEVWARKQDASGG